MGAPRGKHAWHSAGNWSLLKGRRTQLFSEFYDLHPHLLFNFEFNAMRRSDGTVCIFYYDAGHLLYASGILL